MSRYVVINKPELIESYEAVQDRMGKGSPREMPVFVPELCLWFRENQHLIKSVQTTLMVETYRYSVALEFHDPREALVFRLRWL